MPQSVHSKPETITSDSQQNSINGKYCKFQGHNLLNYRFTLIFCLLSAIEYLFMANFINFQLELYFLKVFDCIKMFYE